MKFEALEKIARELGLELEYRRHGSWEDVPYICETALAFYVQTDTGFSGILRNPEKFPRFCTTDYIREAIENEAEDLGICKELKAFSGKRWFRYNEI